MEQNRMQDLEMLMACKVVAENFAANYHEINKINPLWTNDTISSLFQRLDRAFNYYLGLETNRKTEYAGKKLNHIQAQALRAVVFLKTRIEVMYALDADRKNQVLDMLGFRDYLNAIQEKDTVLLLELLGNILNNLTKDIQDELVKNVGDQAFINRLSQYAIKLKKANESQTSLLATKKAIAEQADEIYNELLLDVLDICKTATEFYSDKPEKAKLFDYSSIVQNPLISSISIQ